MTGILVQDIKLIRVIRHGVKVVVCDAWHDSMSIGVE